jgi:site-specific DNA-methyltransferase (cytosine-N4-specific)
MSTLAMEALLAFKKKAELHLCEEFICFNPARLPTPIQWVNVERTRVKDAFTRVWWMSPSPNPHADNRQVLTKYSESMKQLLKRGTYNPGMRPSDHRIGERSFLKKHKGAIPPNVLVPKIEDIAEEIINSLGTTNLLTISNTHSSDAYQQYCRTHDISAHPARMPSRLVEFFILFLTSKGDYVLDPFAGSNTTGAVAELLGRRWVSVECQKEYAKASRARFDAIPN